MSESQMQPGWYYAQGDAPGTQRYWDGTQWVGSSEILLETAVKGNPVTGVVSNRAFDAAYEETTGDLIRLTALKLLQLGVAIASCSPCQF